MKLGRLRPIHSSIEVTKQHHFIYLEAINEHTDAALSNRQKQVCDLLMQSLSDQQIADELFISPATVRNHLKKIYKILRVSSRSSALSYLLNRKVMD